MLYYPYDYIFIPIVPSAKGYKVIMLKTIYFFTIKTLIHIILLWYVNNNNKLII